MRKNIYRAITLLGAVFLAAGIALAFTAQDALAHVFIRADLAPFGIGFLGVMLLLTGALPNVAGVGPTEFAFLLLFAPYAGQSGAALALVLYRAFTYYLPFLVSIGPFCRMGRW